MFEDRLSPTYLKRYSDRYRVVRGGDGIWAIQTRFPERGGITFDVFVFSETHLAALLPPQAADRLLREFNDFTFHQNGDDGKVLLFQEEDLGRFADRLKLRRRRRLSEEQKQKAVERVRRFRFKSPVRVSPAS